MNSDNMNSKNKNSDNMNSINNNNVNSHSINSDNTNCRGLKNNSSINLDNINKYQYVFSLTTEAHRSGLISSKEISKIQTDIMLIVKELILKFNRGRSSSIKVETAQNILESVSYCLDAYCIMFEPLECIKILKSSDINMLYKKGVETIESYVEESKKLYDEIIKSKLDIQLEAYNRTIDNGFQKFFEAYDFIFDTYNTMADIDYPLLFDDMKVQGIKYIKNYFETLKIETQFCNNYTAEMIENILLDYGEIYSIDYKELLINVFELLLNNCIGRKILKKNIVNLEITNYEFQLLANKLKIHNPIEIKEVVKEVIENIISEGDYGEELNNYIRKYEETFTIRLMDALQNGSLDKLIIPHTEPKDTKGLVFTEGAHMEDEEFRDVYNKILEAEDVFKKIDIIRLNVKSAKDFVDILNSDCLFGDEFKILFSNLGAEELAVLVAIVFCEELRNHEFDLSDKVLKNKNVNSDWEVYFINCLSTLLAQNSDKIVGINKILKVER